jgi:hypothetical protein
MAAKYHHGGKAAVTWFLQEYLRAKEKAIGHVRSSGAATSAWYPLKDQYDAADTLLSWVESREWHVGSFRDFVRAHYNADVEAWGELQLAAKRLVTLALVYRYAMTYYLYAEGEYHQATDFFRRAFPQHIKVVELYRDLHAAMNYGPGNEEVLEWLGQRTQKNWAKLTEDMAWGVQDALDDLVGEW